MAPFSLILLVADRAESFSLAGIGGGAFAATSAALGPLRASLVDRVGLRLALVPLGCGFCLGLALIAVLSDLDSLPLVIACGVVGALTPPLGVATKSQFIERFPAPPQLQLSLSLDTLGDIAVLIAGPAATGALISLWSPAGSLSAAALLVATGVIGVIGATAVAISGETKQLVSVDHTGGRLLGIESVRRTVFSMLGVGASVGVLQIAVPALAAEHDRPADSGFILSMFFAASALGILLHGRHNWRWPLVQRYLMLAWALAMTMLPLALIGAVPLLAFAVLGPGLFFGPAMTCAFMIAQGAVPPQQRTTAMAWIATASTAGAAAGMSIAGAVAEFGGTALTFVLGSVLSAIGAMMAPRTRRLLRTPAWQRRRKTDPCRRPKSSPPSTDSRGSTEPRGERRSVVSGGLAWRRRLLRNDRWRAPPSATTSAVANPASRRGSGTA